MSHTSIYANKHCDGLSCRPQMSHKFSKPSKIAHCRQESVVFRIAQSWVLEVESNFMGFSGVLSIDRLFSWVSDVKNVLLNVKSWKFVQIPISSTDLVVEARSLRT